MTPEELDAATLYNKARELAESGDSGAAVKAYRDLCAKFPRDPRFFMAFGVLLQSLGHWEQSIEQFLTGLKLRPSYCEGDARLMLAESYLKAGHKAKALGQWQIVAAMPSEYPSYDAVPNEAKRKLKEHAA
jgi:TolA-binding protein